MGSLPKRRVYMAGLWITLIFVTSSFIIPFHTFVHFVQGLSGSDTFKQWFARFWLVSWFFIVKGWHATEYAILVSLCRPLIQSLTKWNYRQSIAAAFVAAVLFAASDEWHQTFVPGRDGCVRDVLIDSLGAAAAAVFLTRLTETKTRRRS